MATNEQIDYLTSDQLPRPLRDLIERSQARGCGDSYPVIAREWACEVGDRLARTALCQLILILACPPVLMWHYDIGVDFEESFGFVVFYGEWQSALAQVIGIPEPPVPGRLEWYERWREHKELLTSIQGPNNLLQQTAAL